MTLDGKKRLLKVIILNWANSDDPLQPGANAPFKREQTVIFGVQELT